MKRGLVGSIAVLLLAVIAFAGTASFGQMHQTMASSPHEIAMARHITIAETAGDHAMPPGPAHAACQIICTGMTAAMPVPVPVAASHLIAAPFAPQRPANPDGRAPGPALHPPKAAPIA